MPESKTEAKLKPLYVEFHVLRSYPPSNLNRDDLGSPKSIVFGGERRVRVSSQCLKRTWRMSRFFRGELAESDLGIRTKRVPHDVFEKLGASYDDKARAGLGALFAALGKKEAKESGEADEADGAPAAEPGEPPPRTPPPGGQRHRDRSSPLPVPARGGRDRPSPHARG